MPHKLKVKGQWTGQWLGQVKHQGRSLRKTFHSKAEAKAWEVETKREARLPKAPLTTIATVSLIEWLNKYLDYALRYSPKTYSEKKNAVKQFLATCHKDMTVKMLTPGMALEYLQQLFQARSGHAANKARKNLMAAWNYGCRFLPDFPTANPFVLVPEFPKESQARYVPSEEDFWKVMAIAQGQDRVLLLALLHTAARRGEMYRLQWSDVDFSRQFIRLTTRKREHGSLEADWIPMTDELCNALLEHQQHKISEWVFPQAEGRYRGKPYTEKRGFPRALCELAGVQPFGCHAIRHLTASILAKHNTPMITIQKILRHRKLATTEYYVRGLEPTRPYLKVLEGGLLQEKLNDGLNGEEQGLRASTS